MSGAAAAIGSSFRLMFEKAKLAIKLAKPHCQTIHRIHRLQGQLAALERRIETDTPFEEMVIQARAVEKGVSSLITHLVANHLKHQVRDLMRESPDVASRQIIRFLQLLNR